MGNTLRFKVGDYVKVVNTIGGMSQEYIGMIGKILEANQSIYRKGELVYFTEFNNLSYYKNTWYFYQRIREYNEPKNKQEFR